MKVIKRNGSLVDVDFNKITNRIKKLCSEMNAEVVDPIIIT